MLYVTATWYILLYCAVNTIKRLSLCKSRDHYMLVAVVQGAGQSSVSMGTSLGDTISLTCSFVSTSALTSATPTSPLMSYVYKIILRMAFD